MAKLSREYLVEAVKFHAARYGDAGWDVVTEAMSNEELIAALTRARTVTGAVNQVAERIVRPYVDRMVETRPGEDSDPQLVVLANFETERLVNQADATTWWPEQRKNDLAALMGAHPGVLNMVPAQGSEHSEDVILVSSPVNAPVPVHFRDATVEVDLTDVDMDAEAPKIVPATEPESETEPEGEPETEGEPEGEAEDEETISVGEVKMAEPEAQTAARRGPGRPRKVPAVNGAK